MLGLHLQGIFGLFFFCSDWYVQKGADLAVIMTTTRFKHKQK